MKNILKYTTILAVIFSVISCSDWTETKSLDINEADIEKDNPELYAKYLESLREYRNTDHKVMYVWFDNMSGAPVSYGHHLKAIPDSVDVVNIMNPDELASWTQSEMSTIQKDKGMKFVFTISHPDIEKEYDQYLLGVGEEETPQDFAAFTEAAMDKKLALVDKYGFDGISVLFYGMKTLHLTEAQKAEYLAKEAAFMPRIAEWAEQNPGKVLVFEGKPQNLTDKTILDRAEFIVLHTEALKYPAGLSYEVLLTVEDGVPTDRYVIAVNSKSLDPTDDKTGYYFNTENELVSCIPVAAEWVASNDASFTKAGLGIIDVQNEYYNSSSTYYNVRNAIGIMNPSPKF